MQKSKNKFVCSSCGSSTSKWTGQCPDCLEWNSIVEDVIVQNDQIFSSLKQGVARPLELLTGNINSTMRIITPISELNRVLGGGLVSGAAILIGGNPGIGKSTLLLQLCTSLSDSNIGCLYITGEESINQIKLRAQRLNITENKTTLLASTNVEDIISTIDKNKHQLNLVIIDSIQTISSSEFSSAPGTVSQIRACAHLLLIMQSNIILLY